MTNPAIDYTKRLGEVNEILKDLLYFPGIDTLNAPARAACFIGLHIAGALYAIALELKDVNNNLQDIACINNSLESIDETLSKGKRG